jgi:hypothetical protein
MRVKNLKATATNVEVMAEARLWRAVIASAIWEWVSGPLRSKREAEKYLFGNSKDFTLVCESAGMDAGRLRAGLLRFRECAAHRYRFRLSHP